MHGVRTNGDLHSHTSESEEDYASTLKAALDPDGEDAASDSASMNGHHPRDYDDTLRDILGDSNEQDSIKSPARTASIDITIASPPPSVRYGSPNDTASDHSRNTQPFLPRSHSATSSFLSASPRKRPLVHPLISRLRSPSGLSILQQQDLSSSRSSINTFDDRLSRHSSTSNIHGLSKGPSPAPSELFDSPISVTSQPLSFPDQSNPFRWATLRKLSGRIRPQSAVDLMGEPTTMAGSGLIVIGTSKGWTMVFDFSQSLRCICGNEAVVQAAGKVTSLAISSDHTFVAVGHATGYIHLYDISQPGKPYRSVPPVQLSTVVAGRAEGHLVDAAVLHIGFIGGRHTTVVSGDSHGLAFCHSLGKVLGLSSTDVVRLLGKYPTKGESQKTILSLSPLPLGPESHPTDTFNLVAILTPTKLVVVGMKPSPRTWWRSSVSPMPKVNGCIAWLPSLPDNGMTSNPLLAYSEENQIKLLQVSCVKSLVNGTDKKAQQKSISNLEFKDEEVVSVDQSVIGLQWLNQRTLLIMTESSIALYDVIGKQHTGLCPLSFHLTPLASPSPPSHMVRTYKNKIFLMTNGDFKVGSVLSWADRLLALMESGNLVEAVNLAVFYYEGDYLAPAVGLPDNLETKRRIVQPRLCEILLSCLEYIFSPDRMYDNTHQDPLGRGVDRTVLFETFVTASVKACLAISNLDILFDEIYEHYSSNGITKIFLRQIEPFVTAGKINQLPTIVVQELLTLEEELENYHQVEQIIWHVKPECLDINQALKLCLRHQLYDALVYIYTRALHDFVSPLFEMLAVIRKIQQHRKVRPARIEEEAEEMDVYEDHVHDAYKIYPYIADSLSGLTYPGREVMTGAESLSAKENLYSILFAAKPIKWPLASGETFLDDDEDIWHYSFPYFRTLILFDAEATLNSLDMAFEDSFLNEKVFSHTFTRQDIINALLEMTDPSQGSIDPLSPSDTTFVYIFIARNLPKYTQFLTLPQNPLQRVLAGLATDPDQSTREDRQLAAEYLLSVYTPHDTALLASLCEQAGFYRILAHLHQSRESYQELVSVYLRDPDISSHEIFDRLTQTLRLASRKGKCDDGLLAVLLESLDQLAAMNMGSTFLLIETFFPSSHSAVVERLKSNSHRQLAYLRWLTDASSSNQLRTDVPVTTKIAATAALKSQYLHLLISLEPENVIRYLSSSSAPDLDEAQEIAKEQEATHAQIWITNQKMGGEAALSQAEDIFESTGDSITQALRSHIDGDDFFTPSRSEKLVSQLRAALQVTLEIVAEDDVPKSQKEERWFRVLSSLVTLVRNVTTMADTSNDFSTLSQLNQLIPDALSTLIASTSSHFISFPSLIRRLTSSAENPVFGDIRPIISTMLDTYRFQTDVLDVSNSLVKQDLFVHVQRHQKEQSRGWRPTFNICTACGHKILLSSSYPQAKVESLSMSRRPSVKRRPSLKGKEIEWEEEEPSQRTPEEAVVICRNGFTFHQSCFAAQK